MVDSHHSPATETGIVVICPVQQPRGATTQLDSTSQAPLLRRPAMHPSKPLMYTAKKSRKSPCNLGPGCGNKQFTALKSGIFGICVVRPQGQPASAGDCSFTIEASLGRPAISCRGLVGFNTQTELGLKPKIPKKILVLKLGLYPKIPKEILGINWVSVL